MSPRSPSLPRREERSRQRWYNVTGRRLTPERYHLVTKVAFVLLCAIVVSGAAVRLTGSGLGCDDWPNCNADRFVDVSSAHAAIEQVNRLFTGAVAVAVAFAVLGARQRRPYRRDLVLLAYGLVAGVAVQILLGAVLIWVELHPISVQGHFLVSMALVATAVVLVHRAGEPDDEPRPRAGTWQTHRRVLTGITAVALVTGTVVTGAGPHAGDEDAERLAIAIPDAARIHSVSVLVAVAVAVVLAVRIQRDGRAGGGAAELLSSWIFVALLQGAIGYVQYFNDVPELLVGLHVLGATVLWALTVWVLLAVTPAHDRAL